ncbi:MAG: Lrp/AsnC family transcriptional regulator [Candidatus Thorarchaeota archaeon]|nr:Lrp/AsnC family transcriptional regulator [Candidatus Thorarchaeota archaeon]
MPFRVFVAVKTSAAKMEQVRRYLREQRVVSQACSVYTGPYDIIAVVDVDSLDDYRRFALYDLPRIDGIEDYESFIAIHA